ncbi:MAG: InlB B-repeat-containing protein [Clostridiales bacterium]|nr:InlB B-repeat-containing protein [Clostridiales bacterium]
MKRRKQSKLLAVLLAIAMVMTILPTVVFAEGNNGTDAAPAASNRMELSDDSSWEECANCSQENPHMISTPADLDKVRTHTHTDGEVTSITGYFKLANDIVFLDEDFEENGAFYNEGWGWTPIGHNNKQSYFSGAKFCGDFDGNTYAVKNVKMNRPAQYWYNGLFAAVDGNAHVYNLTLDSFNLVGDCSGALCGQGYGSNICIENIKVSNCTITAINTAAKPSAFLIGNMLGGTVRNIEITNCSYDRGASAWKGALITTECTDAVIENVMITDCDLRVYAYTGLLIPHVAGASTIKNITVKGCNFVMTHGAWKYLVYDDSRKAETDSTFSNIVFDDITITGNISPEIMAVPQPKEGSSQIQMDNVSISVKLEKDTNIETVKALFQKDAIYISENIQNLNAGKLVGNANQIITYLNGGGFAENTAFTAGKLSVPIKDGYIFAGWYDNASLTGDAVATPEAGNAYYAQWISMADIPSSITMEYGSSQTLPSVEGVTLDWSSDDEGVVSISNNQITATGAGETTVMAKATTPAGGTATFTVKAEVTPLSIIYGAPKETEEGRPYIEYTLNADGTAPKISELLGFYPVKEGSQNGTYEADIDKGRITLKPGMGKDGDVEYTYENDASGNTITTDTLPTHSTLDAEGNPHSIRVEMKLKTPNYRFRTVGTNWEPKDTIVLYVACYEADMNEVDLYLAGDDTPLKSFEDRHDYVYTGEGIVPTDRDLTTLYSKGENTSNTITKFTAHFHAIEEGTAFTGTHLTDVSNSELTAEALKAIAPTEPGVYSFVINGYNQDTKTYCYVSRRYRIVKDTPAGSPTGGNAESGATLSEVTLSGTMKNAAGVAVEGTFTWDSPNQIVKCETSYDWTFTPNDTDHYNTVTGSIVVLHHDFTGDFDAYDENGHWHICNYADCNATDEPQVHIFTDYISNNDATCTTDGTKTAKCDFCEETSTITDEGSATKHNWGETTYVWSEDGKTCTATHVCLKDNSHTETLQATVTGEQTKAPTCTEKGETTYTAAFDADWASEQTKTVVDIAAAGHRYTEVVTAPTCTEQGYTTHTCSGCADTYKDAYVDAAGHSLGEWETVTSQNCTDKGSEKRTCSVCTFTETRDVDPNGHDWEDDYIIDKEATCITDGSKSIHCKNCEAVKDSTVIPATGHSYSDSWTSNTDKHWHECECGEKSSVFAHTFAWVMDKDATETEAGSKHEECTVCGYTKAAVEIPATGSTEQPGDTAPSGGDNKNPSGSDTDVPQTGDNSNMILWGFLLAISIVGVGATLVNSRKRSDYKNRNKA